MPADWKLTRHDRAIVVDLRVQHVGDTPDDSFGGRACHLASCSHSMTEPFDEQTTIRIEHDLDDARVFERDAQMISQCVLQLADEARE